MGDHGRVKMITSKAEWDAALATDKLVAVDFFATWCGPCRMIGPKFIAMSNDYPNVVFLKIDVDQVADVAEQCEINAMPTFQFYRNKSKIDELVGANEAKLKALIEKHK